MANATLIERIVANAKARRASKPPPETQYEKAPFRTVRWPGPANTPAFPFDPNNPGLDVGSPVHPVFDHPNSRKVKVVPFEPVNREMPSSGQPDDPDPVLHAQSPALNHARQMPRQQQASVDLDVLHANFPFNMVMQFPQVSSITVFTTAGDAANITLPDNCIAFKIVSTVAIYLGRGVPGTGTAVASDQNASFALFPASDDMWWYAGGLKQIAAKATANGQVLSLLFYVQT